MRKIVENVENCGKLWGIMGNEENKYKAFSSYITIYMANDVENP